MGLCAHCGSRAHLARLSKFVMLLTHYSRGKEMGKSAISSDNIDIPPSRQRTGSPPKTAWRGIGSVARGNEGSVLT